MKASIYFNEFAKYFCFFVVADRNRQPEVNKEA